MAKKKINDDTLLQLIRDGNSPTGAARRLGVGRGAVSKRLKALKIGVTRDVTLRSAAKLVDRGMDAMAQLQSKKCPMIPKKVKNNPKIAQIKRRCFYLRKSADRKVFRIY